MHTLKRTVLAVTVVSVMLVTGACSNGSSKKASTTSTTTASHTSTTVANSATCVKNKKGKCKPVKGAKGGILKAGKAKLAYCKLVKADKGKLDLTTKAGAMRSVALLRAQSRFAPAAIKTDIGNLLIAATKLSALPNDAAVAAQKAAILGSPGVTTSYKRINYFDAKGCK